MFRNTRVSRYQVMSKDPANRQIPIEIHTRDGSPSIVRSSYLCLFTGKSYGELQFYLYTFSSSLIFVLMIFRQV